MIISKGKLLIDDQPSNILKMSKTYNSLRISIEEKKNDDFKKVLILNRIAKNIDIEDNVCVIKTNNYKQVKNEVNKLIKNQSFTLKHLSVSKGSLEEVFREMTSNE